MSPGNASRALREPPVRVARGRLAALLGLALLLAAMVVGAVPAAAQNGVGASTPVMINTVGVSADIGAGQRLGKTVPQPSFVVATGVAADSEAGVGNALVKSEWPANRGFLGDPVETTLKTGTRIDRFGGPGGTFASPEGTPFAARSLRSTSINSPYNVYEVAKPVTVQGGTVAPAFGYGGGGIQYEFGSPIQDLIDSGILKRVGP